MATDHCKVPDETEMLQLSAQLEADLLGQYGPLLGGGDLIRALGYPTARAFQQAVVRDLVDVPVFGIPRRRGKFALTKEVAAWLAAQRLGHAPQLDAKGGAA